MKYHYKKDFPVFHYHPSLVYLDSASTTQKPQVVIGAMVDCMQHSYANIHRGAYDLSISAEQIYSDAKKKTAEFLHAYSPHDIIFTYNATYGYNLMARSLFKSGKLLAGDTVLLSFLEHHANIVPWQILAEEYSIRIEWVNLTTEGTFDYDDFREKVKTAKIVSLTGASNVTGEVLDLDIIKKTLDTLENKPIFILDASQRFPHLDVNVNEYAIDICIFTGHKVFSDTGLGVIYMRRDLQKNVFPAFCGGGAINAVMLDGYLPAGLPFRFEPGTPHIIGAASLLSALRYMESIGGYEAIQNHENELIEYILARCQALPSGVYLVGPKTKKNRLGVFSFAFENYHSHDIAEYLADRGIAVRSGHHCTEILHTQLGVKSTLRISVSLYNTKEDIDIFFDTLSQFFA